LKGNIKLKTWSRVSKDPSLPRKRNQTRKQCTEGNLNLRIWSMASKDHSIPGREISFSKLKTNKNGKK